jgi:hypothetical protein
MKTRMALETHVTWLSGVRWWHQMVVSGLPFSSHQSKDRQKEHTGEMAEIKDMASDGFGVQQKYHRCYFSII